MPPETLRVLVTGQTGISKAVAFEHFVPAAADDEAMRLRADEFGVAEVEKHIVGFHQLLVSKSAREQRRRWHDGWKAAREGIERRRFQILGVHLMCCFEGRFSSVVRPADIIEFNPDFIVSLIDDCYSVSSRVDANARDMGIDYHFRLREILSWRYADATLAEQFVSLVNRTRLSTAREREAQAWRPCRHFILAVKHPPQVLVKLLLRFEEFPRTYMCFPISHVRHNPEARQEIDTFRAAVSNVAIAFDPLCIDERILLQALVAAEESGDKSVSLDLGVRWPVSHGLGPQDGDEPIEFDLSEVREVSAIIEDMIEERDLRLIDQSSCLFAYRPWWDRRHSVSEGMDAELRYARDTANIRLFVFDPQRDHSDQRSTFSIRAPQGHIEVADDGFESLVARLAAYEEGRGPREIPIGQTEGVLL